MKYYKVLNDREGGLFSYIDHDEWTVEYKIGEWVYPKLERSPLMVFNDIDSAIAFNKICAAEKLSVYECEITPFTGREIRYLIISSHQYKDYWSCSGIKKYCVHGIPNGTCFADSVKIIRKIMTKEEALNELGKYEPCPHSAIDTGLGNGKIWARCEDCGQELRQENLERYRKSNERFLEALAILGN